MENLNEGKKKKGGMAYEAALREIDAQSAVVALEAKIEKLKEMAETKAQRLEMVSEDENLSELIDKKAMNEMRKEIKQIEKMQEKLEKLYEKKNGKKAPKIVDEEEKMDEGGYGMPSYEEDDVKEEKEETNEEFNRFRKLAGIPLKEDISSHKEEAKRFLEKFIDDNKDAFEFIPDLETGYINTKDNSYNVDELASIFLDMGQDIPRGKYNQKYKGEGGTYVVVA
jgi:hypothetical protein